jgi:hypothetical protein
MQMIQIRLLLAELILLITITTCQKEVLDSQEYPRIRTREVTSITSDGAIFNGEVLTSGTKPILRHGFIWKLRHGTNTEFSDGDVNGTFSAHANRDMYKDSVYTVMAVVETADYKVYGHEISFISKGSDGPTIELVAPLWAQINDTIVIQGQGFSDIQNHNVVFFGNLESKTYRFTNNEIVAIVPDELKAGEVEISVTTSGRKSVYKDNFRLSELTVSGFHPQEATYLDTLIISGENFSKSLSSNEVFFGDIKATCIDINNNYLKVIVPAKLTQPSSDITVKTGSQTKQFIDKFKLKKAQVDNISTNQGKAGDTIIIFGNNFNPLHKDLNQVTLGETKMQVVSHSKTQLSVRVPYELPGGKYEVKILVAQSSISLNTPFLIHSPWQKTNDYSGAYYHAGSGFVIGDEFIFVAESQNEVWAFNIPDESWSRKNDFTQSLYQNSTGVVVNETGLLGLGYSSYSNSGFFYKYLQDSDSWQKLSNIPVSQHHQEVVCIGYGDDAYVFMGDFSRRFWKFNHLNDSWEELDDVPSNGHRYHSSGFELNGVIYIIGGLNGYDWRNYGDVWAYDISTGRWSQKTDFPGEPRHGAALFKIGDKAYYGLGKSGSGLKKDFYEFDPTKNTWKRITDFEGSKRYNTLSFAYNNKGFVMVGKNDFYNTYLKDVWKFTPIE